jgi:histidine decarboxylase
MNQGAATICYGPDGKPWEETVSPLAKFQDRTYLVSPPSIDPASLYDFKEEPITSSWYQVPSSGLTKEQRTRAFDETEKAIHHSENVMLGYRRSLRNGLECVSGQFMSAHLNNGGSAYGASHTGLTTLWMERNVLDYFASLWNAKWPHNPKDPESYWGYTLTMGSTEGNLHALWNARNYLSGKYVSSSKEESKGILSNYHYSQCILPADNPNAFSPVVFYSQEVHYSFMKATEALAIPSFYEIGSQKYPSECPLGSDWPLAVPCEGGDGGSGAIDIEALKTLVDFFSAKGHPIIVIFSYGTTSKGAYDDVKTAGEALVPILKKNSMYERKHYYLADPDTYILRKGFWFHVDGALGASYAPFLQMAYQSGLTDLTPPPIFDFRLNFVASIVTSGHKFIGIPWPCGIYISKTEFQLRSPTKAYISFIEAPDLTLAGSRNAHSALALWSYISTYSYEEQARRAIEALKTAVYAEQKLKELEADIKQDLWVMHSPASLAVGFKRPNAWVLDKYHITGSSLCVGGEWRQYVYVYTIDGELTKPKINELIKDLRSPNAFN